MLKFVVYEDSSKYIEEYVDVINKIMINKNYDYRILKFSRFTPSLKKEIYSGDDEKIFLLDIQTPDVSGIEIAAKIREVDWESIIIFITNYSQYKNEIFAKRLSALDYISKDSQFKDRLTETINIALKAICKADVLVYTFNHMTYRVPVRNIAYIEKANVGKKNYIITLNGEEYEIAGTIKSLQAKLGNRFFRSHNSCLVNLDNIKTINYSEKTITFINDEEIELLSVRSKKGLKEACNK